MNCSIRWQVLPSTLLRSYSDKWLLIVIRLNWQNKGTPVVNSDKSIHNKHEFKWYFIVPWDWKHYLHASLQITILQLLMFTTGVTTWSHYIFQCLYKLLLKTVRCCLLHSYVQLTPLAHHLHSKCKHKLHLCTTLSVDDWIKKCTIPPIVKPALWLLL